MKDLNLLTLSLLILSAGFTSCKKNNSPDVLVTPEETKTQVTEQLKNNPELSTFVEAFKSVPLSQEEVESGVTIFAPTNAAVSAYVPVASLGKETKISADTATKLTQDVLKDHIVKGVFTKNDLTDGKTLVSLSGKQFKILRSGDSIRINGVLLTLAATGSTEMIYTVDQVLTKTKVTDTVTNPIKTCLVSKVTNPSDTSYMTYEYDSQNRIIRASDFYHGKLDESYTYEYTGSQIIEKIYEENVLEETITYTLTSGLPTTSTTISIDTVTKIQADTAQTPVAHTYIETTVTTGKYQHNSEGYLTQKILTETITSTEPGFGTKIGRDTTTYTYQNGNLITQVNSSLTKREVLTYEYYTDKNNSIPNNEFILTKNSKNPVKKVTFVYNYQGGSFTSTTNYTYEYNTDGLIKKVNETYTGSGPQQNYSSDIEYNCK